MNTTQNQVSVKETAFGQDMLEVLIEKQLWQVYFQELDIPRAIKTMKVHLVHKFSPHKGEYPSKLRFLYPTYFDSARVLIAEYVAEFFQTGRITLSELDVNTWEYIEHEIRQITITEREVNTLLKVLCKVQNPNHDMCSRWTSSADRQRWAAHIQEIYRILSKLK